MDGRWEQLWAERTQDDEFIICCIPFFTYGIALGDRVRVGPRKGKRFVVDAVCERSGRRVYRLWLKGAADPVRDSIGRFFDDHKLLYEWSSLNLLSIDVPNDERSSKEIELFVKDLDLYPGVMFELGTP
jgi:hypothetical protein